MRNLLPLPVLLFMTLPVFSQFVPDPFSMNDAELQANKNARVHFVHKYLQPEEWEDPADDGAFLAEVEYAENGFPIQYIEQEEYWDDDEDWDTTFTAYYVFSGPGNRLSRIESVDSDLYEVISVFTYDKKGNLLKKESAEIDPPTYKYDYEKGRIISCKVSQKFPEYDEEGDFTGKAIDVPTYQYAYAYDKNGRVSWETMYQESEGEQIVYNRTSYEYDEQGRLSAYKVFFDEEGSEPSTETTYFYDSRGLLTKYTEHDLSMGIEMTYEFRYTFFE